MPVERKLPPHTEDDARILAGLERHDINALSELYEKYVQDLYNYGKHISRDGEQVEDAIQDVMLEIWNMKERIGEVVNIRFYMYKILRRLLLKGIRMPQPPANKFPAFSGSHEEELIMDELGKDQEEMLRLSVNALPPRQREIIFLRFYEGMDLSQIAEILQIQMPSLYNLLNRALNSLRDELGKHHSSALFLR